MRIARPFVALPLAWLVCACGGPAEPVRPSVVLVTVDTLRADHLGLYGHPRPTSPNLDRLGEESVVFENAITTCPSTAPATASILTGVHHASHAVHENGAALPERVTTLAEHLKAAGYATAAVVTNPVVGNANKGFGQGFDAFFVPPAIAPPVAGTGRVLRRAESVVQHAERLLDKIQGRPIFLWLHLMDPHGPYSPPAATQDAHRDALAPHHYERDGEATPPLSKSNYGLSVVPRYQGVPGRTRPADYRAAYATEIRYADEQLGVLVARLQTRGLWDGNVFALTADHGESLGEHGYYFQHGWFTYDDSLRVPLLLRAPGLAPARVASSVSLVDLAPTLLELVDLPANTAEGRSLLPVVHGEEGDRPAFAHNTYSNQLTALRLGSWSYIFTPPPNERARARDDGWRAHWPETTREELYDLRADPGETRNLAAAEPEQTRALRERMRAWLGDQQTRTEARPPVAIDPEMEEALRALGYLD